VEHLSQGTNLLDIMSLLAIRFYDIRFPRRREDNPATGGVSGWAPGKEEGNTASAQAPRRKAPRLTQAATKLVGDIPAIASRHAFTERHQDFRFVDFQGTCGKSFSKPVSMMKYRHSISRIDDEKKKIH
jgi:hypothetical protein